MRLTLRSAAALLLLGACTSDANISDRARCDGALNTVETGVDSPFDEDEDGYFDGTNEECIATYAAELLDCNDGDADVHPGMAEETCNDLDDDCDEETLDAPDADEDGATICDGDCDDAQPAVGPDLTEFLCDGLDNDCDELTPDADDTDNDTYDDCDDCDDEDPEVNPATAELACNGKDDDCNELTDDGDDFDTDGFIHCFDCDDQDPLRFPGAVETCGDGIDQDCDTFDLDCPPPTWDGLWDTTPAVSYSCASNSVVIDFASVTVLDQTPNISFSFVGGTQPGTTTGTINGTDSFSTSLLIPGLCNENFTFNGSFTSETEFTATLTAAFTDGVGGLLCGDCLPTQSWTVTGSR